MKNILTMILCLFALLFTGNLHAQDYKWIQITYFHNSGPVSPDYQYNYTITLNADGRTGTISYQKGMSEDLNNLVKREFTISKKSKTRIDKAFISSGIFTNEFKEMPPDMRMVGGPVNIVTVTYGSTNPNLDQPVRVKEIPSNLNDSDKAKMQDLYDAIRSALPKSTERKVEKDLGTQI